MAWYCKVKQTFSFHTRGEVLELAKRISTFQERLEWLRCSTLSATTMFLVFWIYSF